MKYFIILSIFFTASTNLPSIYYTVYINFNLYLLYLVHIRLKIRNLLFLSKKWIKTVCDKNIKFVFIQN